MKHNFMTKSMLTAMLALGVSSSAWATDDFRVHRWESFYGLPVTTGNTVFVGNSITNMHDWWEAFGDNQAILNRGTSGGFTYEVLDHLEMIIAGKPGKLFLGIGTNDITAYPAETVADNIRIIAERVINESPSTKIYVQSVLPSTSGNRGRRNPALNSQIEQQVAALKAKYPTANLEYVNVFDLFVASDGYSIRNYNGLSLAFDALHPTVLGYGLWCNEIAGRVGSDCVYDTNVSQMYPGGQGTNSTGDRITCFAQQLVDADDVLFIGDELVSSGEWHELFGSPNVKNRGLGWGYTGSQLTQEITNAPIYFQNAASVAPKAIVVYAGVQEAINGLSAADFKSRYTQLITALRNSKATSDKTKIFLLSPLNTRNASQNTLLASYQTQLQTLASELPNVHYIDATSINNAASENYYVGDGANYLTSLGYVRLANVIESALTAQLGDLGHHVVTEAEAVANKALYTRRDLVGDALTLALRIQGMEGNGAGQYQNVSALPAPISEAFTLLAASDISETDAAKAKSALESATPEINQPAADKYYTLCSVNRNSKYLTSDGTNVIGTNDANYAKNQWKLVARGNGSFDLVNRGDGKFLNTASYNQTLTVSNSAPANGWTFTGCNTAGLYNVASGTCEINMTTSDVTGGKKVVNWSKSQNGDDRADLGCQFKVVEVEGEPEILPEVPVNGKVYTVYNDHVGTPYYLNDQFTSSCTALSATKASDNSQQWIVWGSATGGYKLYNAKNHERVMTFNDGVQNVDVSEAHALRGVSLRNHGTNQHMAGNKTTLTLSGGKFTSDTGQHNEFNDLWSTDFVFASTGENAYKVEGGSVTVAGQAYANGEFIVTESTLTATDVTVEEGKTVRIANNTISVGDEVAPDYYTLTNHQYNGTTYPLYIANGTLTIGGAGVEATSLGDAALFSKEEHNGKWAFKNKATGQYLIWRGNDSGYNNNSGVLNTYNATYCDFTPVASAGYPGGYYFVGKRDGGSTDGTWVISNTGEWNKWGNTQCWQSGYSNVFTLDLVAADGTPEGTEVSVAFNAGTLSGGSTSWRNTWTSSSTPAVKVEAYNTTNLVGNLPGAQSGSDGFIAYTGNRNAAGATMQNPPFTSYLRVSAPTGYYVTGYSFDLASYDLTATGLTVTTPKGSHTVNNNSAVQSEQHVFTGTERTYFDITLLGENKGVKFTDFKVFVKELENVPTPSLAFEVSPEPANGSFADGTHWYALRFVNGGYWKANDDNSVTVQGRTPDATFDAGLWAITGDDAKGYSLYNKAKGASVRLSYASVGDGVAATFATTGTTAFTLATSSASLNPQAYTLHYDANCYINKYKGNSVVATWNDSRGVNDAGSGIIFEAAEDLVEDVYNTAYVFDNAASSVPYRIPAIAKNQAGDLIAVADYRYSGQDIGMATNGRLDLRFAIKDHATGQWSDVNTLVACGNWSKNSDGQYVPDANGVFTAFGDPCIVADRTSNKVMVTSCCGNVSFPDGTHAKHQGWSRFISEDGGKTWSTGYIDLSDQVLAYLDQRSDGQIRSFFIGSGKISQSRTIKVGDYYRLYCAALVQTSTKGNYVNYAFYSDDFGLTWKLLGEANIPAVPGGNEPKADELPDGSVILSSRTSGGRFFNVFHYTNTIAGEGAWTTAVKSQTTNGGTYGADCNGETMNVPVRNKQTGAKTFLLLQSVPKDGNRNYVSIYYKNLPDVTYFRTGDAVAKDWDGYLQLSNTSSAYSTMCLDKDNHIAFFYEENSAKGGYDMVYKNVTIEQLTSDKYEYCAFTHEDSVAYLRAAIEPLVESVKDANFGPYVGQYAASAQSAIEAAVAAYQAAPATAAYDALNLALATATTRRINPAKQYRILNFNYTTKAMQTDSETIKAANIDENSDSQRFTFEEAGDGVYYLKTKSGSYYGRLGDNETQAALSDTKDNAGIFRIDTTTDGKAALYCTNKTGSNWYIHLAGDQSRLVPWNTNAAATFWHILPVDEPLDVTGEGEYTENDVKALNNIIRGVATKENNESQGFRYNFDAADMNDDGIYSIGDLVQLIRLLLKAGK